MKLFLRGGPHREVELLTGRDARHPDEPPLAFATEREALAFLAHFGADARAMAKLRSVLGEDRLHGDVSSLHDHDVLGLIAWQLVAGRVKVTPAFARYGVGRDGEAEEEVAERRAAPARELSWIAIRVVDDETGDPIPGIAMKVTLPDGSTADRTTASDGTIEIDGIQPGTCAAECDMRGALLADSYGYVSMGGTWSTPDPKRGSRVPKGKHLLWIEEHKVRTGETLATLAQAGGLTEQRLSTFNWGTADPKTVNERLRDEVGCTKKSKDGRSYVFDDLDDPGLVYVPRKWEARGLATAQHHVVRVTWWRRLILQLHDDHGHPIPDTPYRIAFTDGTRRTGQLGRSGLGVVLRPPDAPFAVTYLDHEDIRAKSLAACVRQAFDDRDCRDVFRLLEHPPETIQGAIAAYERYFNDYTGNGLLADIRQEVTDPDAAAIVEALLIYAGIEERPDVRVTQRVDRGEWGRGDG